MLAGQSIIMRDTALNDGLFSVAVASPDSTVTDTGSINAINVELKTNGGNILALAGNADTFINATGVSSNDGHIWLTAGDNGTLTAAGAISAQQGSGDGGTVVTSGGHLNFDNLLVDTTGTTGVSGNWLIASPDLTVEGDAAHAVSDNLSTTNVKLSATSSGTGNITLNAPLSWSTANSLTLDATHRITINAPITVAGNATVSLISNDLNGDGLTAQGKSDFGFGLTSSGFSGSLDFTGTPNGGQALNIDNHAYTLLYSMSDLAGLSDPNGHYALATSLDATGTNYTSSVLPVFDGTLSGLGHTLSNVHITSGANTTDLGLISTLDTDGTVRDLGLAGASVTTGANSQYVGALVGNNKGTLFDVAVVGGSVMADAGSQYVGGLVGANNGTITNSLSSTDVSAGGIGLDVGGLAGTNFGKISTSYATGSVSVGDGGSETGGFVGVNLGTITNAYASGSVNGGDDSTKTGGFAGLNLSYLTNVLATGSVTGGSNATELGGLVGLNYFATITNGYYDYQTTGQASGLQDNGSNGLSTSALQGTLQTGFAAGTWVTGPGFYTYLDAFGAPANAQKLSGHVFTPYGAAAGASVTLYSGGSSLGTTQSAANGYYAELVPTGTVNATTGLGGSLTLSGDPGPTGAAYTDSPTLISGNVSGFVINSGSFDTATSNTTYSGLQADMAASFGSSTLASLTTALNTTPFTITARNGFIVDTALAQSTDITINSLGGDLTISTPLSFDTAQNLTFKAQGSIYINTPISWDSGTLTLNAADTVTDAYAINGGAHSVFNLQGGSWSQVGAVLPTFSVNDFQLHGGTFVRALSGNGSSASPYLLTDIYGIQGITTQLGANYSLANDIDATGVLNWNGGDGFNPIGTVYTPYLGTFDGQGHTLSNFQIHRPNTDYVALFVANSGTIQNLNLVGGSAYPDFIGGLDTASLAVFNSGAISNVNVTAIFSDQRRTISYDGAHSIGGMVATNFGSIDHSTSHVYIGSQSTRIIGGMVATNYGTLTYDNASGSIRESTVVGGPVGGLAGINYGPLIDHDYFTGSVQGSSNQNGQNATGGLIGLATTNLPNYENFGGVNLGPDSYYSAASAMVISNSSTYANVSNGMPLGIDATHSAVGGLIGYTDGQIWHPSIGSPYIAASSPPITLIHDHADGFVSCTSCEAGGLVGGAQRTNIDNSYATAFVGSKAFAGGLVGYFNNVYDVSLSPSRPNIFTQANTGGITNSYATGNVGGYFNSGGLVGYLEGSISNSYASGEVYGFDGLGGLVGVSQFFSTIDNSFATGSVTGISNLGGLVGINGGYCVVTCPVVATINNSYASGAVSGFDPQYSDSVGGLVGSNNGDISNTYATGWVYSANQRNVGGLIGKNQGGFSGLLNGDQLQAADTLYNAWGTVTNSYYDFQTTGAASGVQADGSTGLSTAALQGALPTGFAGAGWSTAEGLYPYLTAFYTTTPQAISGSVYQSGQTPSAGANVNLYLAGNLLTTTTSGANGYYYYLAPAGTVSGTTKVGATVSDGCAVVGCFYGVNGAGVVNGVTYGDGSPLTQGNLANFDIHAATFSARTANTSYSGLMSDMAATFGTSTLTDLQTSMAAASQVITAAHGFSQDVTPWGTGALSLKTLGGDLTIAAPLTFGGANGVSLDAYGSVFIDAPVTISGTGAAVITTNDGGTGGDYGFGLGSSGFTGFLSFTGAPNSGQSLTINGNPYTLIYTASDLVGLNNATGRYALANNLDLTGTYSNAVIGTLRGTFTGLGHRLSNLTVTTTSGLSGFVGVNRGTLRDLGLTQLSVTGGSSSTNVGGLVGYNLGTVTDASVSGTISGGSNVGGLVGYVASGSVTNSNILLGSSVSGSGSNIGGIAGYSKGTLSADSSAADVNGTAASHNVGGLAGETTGLVDQSDVSGSVSGGSNVGGLVGYVASGSVTNSSLEATSIVSGSGSNIGGIAGYNKGTLSADRSGADVNGADASHNVGGIAGYNQGTLSLDHYTGDLQGGSQSINIGGLAGYSTGSIDQSDVSGSVSGGGNVGGLVGYVASGSVSGSDSLTGSVVTGSGNNIGGIAGYNKGTLSGDSSLAEVNGAAASHNVGGIAGYNQGTLSLDHSLSTVQAGSLSANIGGLAGYNTGSIDQSDVSGSVSGGSIVGGLVGYVASGSVTNSNALTGASVTGSGNYLGGLAGYNKGTLSSDSASANVHGLVASSNYVGGLVGKNLGTVDDDHATGNVTGHKYVGAIFGYSTTLATASTGTGTVNGH